MAVNLGSMRATEVIWGKEVVKILVPLLHKILHEIQRVAMEQAAFDLHICCPLTDKNAASPLHAASTVVSAVFVCPVQHSNNLELAQQGASVVPGESAILNLRFVNSLEEDDTSHVWKCDVQRVALEFLELVDLSSVVETPLVLWVRTSSLTPLYHLLLRSLSAVLFLILFIKIILPAVVSADGRDLVRTALASVGVCVS